jgi:BirA family biotin operon repressor/biotin-[acetyl-CoA-carboxylase] ligase
LTDTADLSIETIRDFFRQSPAKTARNIYFFHEAGSTNDIASAYADSGCEEGTVIIADSQSKGRGRLGRTWFSPSGKNIHISVVLRPVLSPMHATVLTIMTSVAVASVIRQTFKIDALIKWPNDIMVSGRKMAGILSEMKTENDKIMYAVIGIGINTNLTSEEIPDEIRETTTSLYLESGKITPRTDVVIALLQELDRYYGVLKNSGSAALIDNWTKLSATIGKNIRVASGAHVFEGTAEAIDNDGFLLIRLIDGSLKKISSGDVTVIQ